METRSTPVARSDGRCPCCGTMLPSRTERRLTILDAMVMVVATAGTLALSRPFLGAGNPGRSGWVGPLAILVGVLVTWTPTVLWLRLRQPRPTVRRLARQPGFAAGVVGTSILALGVVATVLLTLIRLARQGMTRRVGGFQPSDDPLWWNGVVLHFAAVVGPAVIAAWIVLALAGRRRPVRGWIDGLGRAIGAGWIILFVINCCFRLAYLQG